MTTLLSIMAWFHAHPVATGLFLWAVFLIVWLIVMDKGSNSRGQVSIAALPLVLAACVGPSVEVRRYQDMGKLKEVRLYSDPNQVSAECVARSGGKDDRGEAMSGASACADRLQGVVRIYEGETVRVFLHELCHLGDMSPATCDRIFPGKETR